MMARSFFQLHHFFFCVTFLAMLASCGVDDGPAPGETEILKVVVDRTYFTGYINHWIVVSDALGEVVTATSFETGETFSLYAPEAAVADGMTVTILKHEAATIYSSDSYQLVSYINVPPGSTWNLQTNYSFSSQPYAVVNLSLFNVPDAPISTRFSSQGKGVQFTHSEQPNDYLVAVNTPVSDLHVSLTGAFEPRYKLLDLTASREFSLDVMAEFDLYEEVLLAPLVSQQLSLFVLGYSTGEAGAHTLAGWHGSSDGQLKIGLNHHYDTYSTKWTAQTASGALHGYTRLGEAPTAGSFQMADLNFEVSDAGINTFDFSADAEFSYYEASWSFDNPGMPDEPRISWKVLGPADGRQLVIKQFSGEVGKAYPDLNNQFSRLVYVESTFTAGSNGHDYEDLLERTFVSGNHNFGPVEFRTLKK